jgi:N-methylhydantoinase B/oxoprolinase/acetone carboxylase alpha subunit
MQNDRRRGCLVPDYAVIKPVFLGGEMHGFVANIAHVPKIGGCRLTAPRSVSRRRE